LKIIIKVLATDKELVANNLHRLSNQLNFVDFGQVLLHVVVTFFIIFPNMEREYQVIARTAVCTLNSLWLAMYPIMSALSISRILVVKEIISPNKFPVYLKAFIVIGWLYTIGVWLWGCFTQNMIISGVGLAYDLTKFAAPTLSQLEWYLCVPSLIVTCGAYFVIVLHMQATKRNAGHLSWSREAKILFQATFLTIYMLALVVVWHYSDQWLKTDASIALLQITWILFLYCNPILLISLNPTIRKKVTQSIACSLFCHPTPRGISTSVSKSSFVWHRSSLRVR
ncbi:hypothetical protein ANCCAN_02675, partial [Ancylostoma caninum]